MEARNDYFHLSARMEAWTEADAGGGFRYHIVGEDGSGYIRSRVLRAALEAEQKMWALGEPARAALTEENYLFEERGAVGDGLASIGVKARRRDLLLIDGTIFVKPEDGELVRIEGRLSKAPSFWTRRVDIVRQYQRIGGVHVPVSLESIAQVLIAGQSTFRMIYDYEMINGHRVGNPVVSLRSAVSSR